ncbi:hypothetical protein [Barrientosiimonas humi]|uniref:hypothetical protein n=1 Tax=Barrientosiimonas humi TaxID=999931 RepID=UPI00370DA9F6
MSNSGSGWDGYGNDWRDQEFGHGQEQYYRGLQVPGGGPGRPEQQPASPGGPGDGRTPAPISPQPPPRRSGPGRGLVVGGIAAALLLVGGGIGTVLALRGGDPDVTAGPAGSASQQAAPTTSPASAAATPSAEASPPPPPGRATALTAGSQVNDGSEAQYFAAYDVPGKSQTFTDTEGKTVPAFDVRTVGTYAGFADDETGKPTVIGRGPTYYRDGYCAKDKTDSQAMFVWHNARSSDPAGAAPLVLEKWVEAIAEKKDGGTEQVSAQTTRQVMVNGGRTKAAQSRQTVTNTDTVDKCGVKKTEVVVTAFDTGKGTATLVLVRDEGPANAMTAQQGDAIIATLRPSPGATG